MNSIIVAAVAAWLIAQVIKTVRWAAHGKRVTWRVVVGTGGMPSSHTSFVCATAFGCGLRSGFNSVDFALGVALAAVVVYDALGVRREAGRHAEAINHIEKAIGCSRKEPLQTSLGHRPLEVVGGGVLGIACAAVTTWIMYGVH